MLLVANLAKYKMMQKKLKMVETQAYGYSSESTQLELSNGYQHDRVSMVFRNLCVHVLCTNVVSVLEGLMPEGHMLWVFAIKFMHTG